MPRHAAYDAAARFITLSMPLDEMPPAYIILPDGQKMNTATLRVFA